MWDKAYYITVNRFKERQKHCDEQFKNQELIVEKFLGIDKRIVNTDYLVKNNYVNGRFKLSTAREGNAACLLSHCTLYKKIWLENKDNDKEVFLIFEDDVELQKDFMQRATAHMEHCPKDWDMVWLGSCGVVGKAVNSHFIKPRNNAGRGKNCCHHCYLIKKSSIKKLLNLMFPINYISKTTKDLFLRRNFHRFNAYFLSENLAFQSKKFISTRKYQGNKFASTRIRHSNIGTTRIRHSNNISREKIINTLLLKIFRNRRIN